MIRLENAACSNCTTFSHVVQVSYYHAVLLAFSLLGSVWIPTRCRLRSTSDPNLVEMQWFKPKIQLMLLGPEKSRSLPKKWWNYQLYSSIIVDIIEPSHFKDFSIESQTDAWVWEGFEAWIYKFAGILHMSSVVFGWWHGMEQCPCQRNKLHLSSICCGGSFLRLHSDILCSFLREGIKKQQEHGCILRSWCASRLLTSLLHNWYNWLRVLLANTCFKTTK